jgi:putative oxidoreductase
MNWALLLLRIVAGLAFVLHGLSKAQHPLTWMGPDTPAVFQLLAVVAELGGGVGWMLGFLTPIASMGIASTMVVAIGRLAIVRGDPFLGGWELAAVYLCVAILLGAAGPGRFAVDPRLLRSLRLGRRWRRELPWLG